jgi:hypothetical protein
MNPGDRVVYHVGNLVNERDKGTEDAQRLGVMADRFYIHGTPPDFSWANDRAVNGMASGHLFQRRDAGGRYTYIFIRGA